MLTMLPSLAMAGEPKSQSSPLAEGKIKEMFNDLKTISNVNSSRASEIRLHFVDKYFAVADQNAPNEFRFLGFDEQDYNTDIAARNYVNTFYDMFRNHEFANCSFSFETRWSSEVNQPEFKKGEAPAKLAQVVVRKVYSKNGKPYKAFEDTLIVGLEKLRVHQWANESSRHHIGDVGNGEILDIEQMKVNAALAYDKKQYIKAYQIYQTIANKYPTEGDSFYYMAIMLYKKEYGKNISKKERNTLILDYLNNAISRGGFDIRRCADNMRYWITC